MVARIPEEIPRKIWIMWLQGLEQAPRVVKECYKTWEALNPGWDIVFLDETNFHEYVDLTPVLAKQPLMEKAALSDIIRIKLLAEYGGVWVDATCYCQTPLDDWLGDVTQSGFFAFYKPVESSLVAVWFLVASRGNALIAKWAEMTEAYVLKNPNLGRRVKTARWFKWFATNTSTTRHYFSYPVKRIFKVYPYYWFMFLFAEVIRKDPQSRQVWARTPKLSPPNPGQLYHDKLLAPITKPVKNEIDNKETPIYKLTWRYDAKDYVDGCVLEYILSSDHRDAGQKLRPTSSRTF